MYIVAIAWLYVAILMALTERSLTAGVMTFVFYGLAPLALLLWLTGTPHRRRLRARVATTETANGAAPPAPDSESRDTPASGRG
jgi:Na+-transporting methylmalonyl-CoA/oxaloacetate decarboxylase gamma subunit